MSKLMKYNKRSFFDGLGSDLEVRILSFLFEDVNIDNEAELQRTYGKWHIAEELGFELLTSKKWVLLAMTNWGRFTCSTCEDGGWWGACANVFTVSKETKIELAKQLLLSTSTTDFGFAIVKRYPSLMVPYYESVQETVLPVGGMGVQQYLDTSEVDDE